MSTAYQEFIASKVPRAEAFGFEPITPAHDCLKPHQSDIARWLVVGGRRACFIAFGGGKTRIHLQVAKWIAEVHPGEKYLIVAPLGVRFEFTKEQGPAMGADVVFCRTDAEVDATSSQIIITNYESVRDGKMTVSRDRFCGAGLDEASVLRSFGSKTYQTFLDLFKSIKYRFVFTATPSPNRHKELIHYGGFLGVMDTGDALTRFFQRNSEKAGDLTLYPHMEDKFWMWLSTWAVFMQKPSDLGYSDEGYDLPPGPDGPSSAHVHWHRIPVDHSKAWQQADSWGQSQLFRDQSSGLPEQAEVKRETMILRTAFAKGLIEADTVYTAPEPLNERDRIIDVVLHHVASQHVLRQLIVGEPWPKALSGDAGGTSPYKWDATPKGIATAFGADSGEGWVLIKPKEILARVAQYSPQPARHWVVWHELEDERRLLEKVIPGIRTAYGSQDLDEREEIIIGFAHGQFPILGTKPSIAGSGTNLQRHCSDAIFLGSTYKFNDFIQAIHRIYRFQQSREVHIHVIYSEAEEPVVNVLKQKWTQHNALVAKMTDLIRKHGLALNPVQLVRDMGVQREEVSGELYRAIFNDCIPEVASWPDNCVDEIVSSIPFGTQYEYSPNFCDLGHNEDNEAFFRQMDFLVPNLLRILKPGRVACIHVKDRIRFGNVTGRGTPTVDRFSDKTADLFERHGFWFMGRITIDTDVVRENNQTYRLGWSEVCKDGTKMGVGMPEYVLILRKPPTDCSNSYADEPVTKDKADYGRSDWQVDAAGLWKSNGVSLPDLEALRGIPLEEAGKAWRKFAAQNPYCHACHVEAAKTLEREGTLPAKFMLFPPISRHPDIWTDVIRMRVLNAKLEQRNRENHICPLQIDVVERLITRYSNPGDVVYDPFAGIFTVPYVAIGMGRIGWGTELARNYWKDGVDFCQEAERTRQAPEIDLFAHFNANSLQAEVVTL